MGKRAFSSLVLSGVIAAAVFSYTLCFIFLLTFILIALWEFFGMIEKKGVRLFKGFGLVLGAVIPLSICFKFPVTVEWQFIFILAALFTLFILELSRKENHQTVLSISATLFGVIYISWCLSFLIRLRQLPGGAELLLFLLVVIKASDLGAYLVGTAFGRTPLLKRVSPHKSLEGALGGFLLSVLLGIALHTTARFGNLWQTIFISAILGILSQLGDLFESLLKRDCGVKDSWRIIPGMGGILDVVDSIIFGAPAFYLYITMVRPIVGS